MPTNAYKTKDGYVNVAPIPDVAAALQGAGPRGMDRGPEFATHREVRRKRRKEINGMIADIIAEMDSATLLGKLEAAEVPGGPIYTIEQAYNDPQAKHMELTQTVTATDGKQMRLPRQPFTLSRTGSRLMTRTPEFAEHTDEVLAEFGFSTAEIKGFRERGSVE